ncbi:hypothetical protein GCM10009839_75150 [Catenulispora yoronensis]|uniref:Uncharacterized protein n=1 Tax=Catenulispora yoronensis TaxID=450799 RepID=A0ABN2VAU1_9ACTN
MTSSNSLLVQLLDQEFRNQRRGWGLQSADLRSRTAGQRLLSHVYGVTPEDSPGEVRRKAVAAVRRLSADFPDEMRLAVEYALAISPDAQWRSLSEREHSLAQTLLCSARTARRRVQDAFQRLAEEAAAEYERVNDQARTPDGADEGWAVRSLESLLRLDTPMPEVTETRSVVALRPGLRRIVTRFSLPRLPDGVPAAPDVVAEVQYGATLRAPARREGEGHFLHVLDLPRELGVGEHHEYSMTYRIPEGYVIRPYYAFVPLVACDAFRLRVRFGADRLPSRVRRFHGVPPRRLLDRDSPGEPLELDAVGEVALEFDRIRAGFAYGIAWQPAVGDTRFE